MKKLLLLFSIFAFISCGETSEKESATSSTSEENTTENTNDSIPNFGIVIHGGAGTILKKNMTDSLEKAYKVKLEEAKKGLNTILLQN